MIKEMGFGTYHEIIVFELRAATRRYFDVWEDVLDKEEIERPLYAKNMEQYRLPIIVLSCTLLESSINFYLSTKCTTDQFKEIERKSLREKWKNTPQEFVSTYCLPPNGELENDLSKLVDRRNAIIHSKPTMSMDGDNRHTGNEPPVVWDEHDFIERCVTLPFKLVRNLIGFEPDSFMYLSNIHTYCGTAASEFEKGQNWLKIASQYSRELIHEIMQQGYDRRTAVQCAILMGDEPKTDDAGNIRIQINHRKEIILKSLNFFASK